MPQLADELHHGSPVPDRPAIVVAATGTDPGMRLLMSPVRLRAMTEAKRRLYAALAASVSHGELRVLEDAQHSTLTIDQADVIVQATRDLLAQVTR